MSQAVVFCCNNRALIPGFSERIPFCLMPVGGKPLITHIIERLAGFGVRRMLLILERLPTKVVERIQALPELDASKGAGLCVEFFHHAPFLGIGETLLMVQDRLERDFLVLPQLALPGADLPGMMREHTEKHASLTWLTTVHPADGELKPQPGCVALCMNRRLLDESPPPALRSGEELVARYREQATFHDHFRAVPFPSIAPNHVVDDLESLWRANRAALNEELPFLRLTGRQTLSGIRMGDDCSLDRGARLIPPVITGNRCIIGPGATVGPFAVIGTGTVIREHATVTSSVVLDNGYVGTRAMIHSAVLGNGFLVRHPEGEVVDVPTCTPPQAPPLLAD